MFSGLNLAYCQGLVNHNLKIMSHYFEKAKFFLYVTLRNLVNECDEGFASVTLTSWVILIVLIWSVIYLVYRKVFDAFLKRMTLQLLYRSHLTKSSWNAGFCISSIPLCITKLLGQENRVADVVNVVDNIFITEKILPAHVLFSYVVICSYYIHNICLMYVQKGFDTEFFAKGQLLVFLYTCYSIRYVRVGLSAIVLINVCSLNIEFMRICYCLNQSKMMKSGFVRNFTCVLFVIHYILWAGVYLYALPHFYLLPAINIQLSSGNLLSLLVLCATLWSYFCLEISCAPAMKLIRYCVWPDYSYGRQDWLLCVLFLPHSDVIQHLKQIQSMNIKNKKELQNGGKRSRNSVALYQTVKCVMAMKKIIRRKRAAKALASSTSEQLEIADCSNVQGNM